MAWTNFAGYSGPGAQSPRATDETIEPETAVLFRADRSNGQTHITAVFPCIPATTDGSLMVCYAHVGQHSGCSHGWYNTTRAATPAEYADLKRELESAPYGYRLKIYKRLSRQLRDAFAAELRALTSR